MADAKIPKALADRIADECQHAFQRSHRTFLDSLTPQQQAEIIAVREQLRADPAQSGKISGTARAIIDHYQLTVREEWIRRWLVQRRTPHAQT